MSNTVRKTPSRCHRRLDVVTRLARQIGADNRRKGPTKGDVFHQSDVRISTDRFERGTANEERLIASRNSGEA